MYVHGGLADFRQPAFAVHIIIGDIGGICVHVMYTDDGKNV